MSDDIDPLKEITMENRLIFLHMRSEIMEELLTRLIKSLDIKDGNILKSCVNDEIYSSVN